MSFSGAKSEVLVGGPDIDVGNKGVLAIFLRVVEVSMGEYWDFSILVLDNSAESGSSLFFEVREGVGDGESNVRADTSLRRNSLLSKTEMGGQSFRLELKLDVLITACGINLGLVGELVERNPSILKSRGSVL